MALDTLLEKPLSVIEAATAEELDELVRTICNNSDLDASRLTRCISRCDPHQVHFEKLRHLQIIGDNETDTLETFERYGISQGFYLNADATWLLLFLPEHFYPADYLSRCSDAVESLYIWNAPMLSLDVSTLTGLKLLYLEGDPLLDWFPSPEFPERSPIEYPSALRELPSLKKLRNLTELKICWYGTLEKLDLSGCTSLMHLDLSGCYRLTNLDLSRCDALTTLDLSECDALTTLGLSQCDALTTLDLSECDALTTLDLFGCTSLTKLCRLPAELTNLNLSGCINLTNLDLLGCENLTALNLSGCESLTSLDFSECARPITLNLSQCKRLTNLVFPEYEDHSYMDVLSPESAHLNLSNCESLTELYLSGYDNLIELDLTGCNSLSKLSLLHCGNLTKLRGLEKLTQLVHLELFECDRLTELHCPDAITQLTTLALSGDEKLASLCGLDPATQLTAFCGLRKFTKLTMLDLSQCNSLTTLRELPTALTSMGLFECENLTRLDLSGCKNLTELLLSDCENLVELHGFESRSQLTELSLTDCFALSTLDLSGYENLTKLYFYGCENLVELRGFEVRSQLTELSLIDCGALSTLDLSGCENLTKLNLFGCRSLTELKGLENLAQLTDLTLSDCSALLALPNGIRRLPSLRRLDLRNMHLAELPDWLPEIAEQFPLDSNWSHGTTKAVVLLQGTKVDGMDMSIFGQPYEMVVKWFEARKASRTQPLNEIKVIFLGDGEAGKSYTISRLINNGGAPVDYEGVRTPGISIKNHPCKFDNREFKVNYWDFGGQEIMHSMHRVFLTNRTMYVVLVSASDHAPIERARYWLRNIKSFAPDAPVLLVLNKIDVAPHVSMELPALQAENSNLIQLVRLSALEFDQQQFDSEFRNVLLQSIINTKMLDVAWPKSWIDVKTRMENLGEYYIPLEDYEEICANCQVEDVQAELLDWFNDLGISFCFRDNFRLENQVILEPRWITNGLYIILFNLCEDAKNGMVPHRSIHSLLKKAPKDASIKCTDRRATYKIPGDAEYVLGIMRQFGLSLQIDNDIEFIPMLCQAHPTLDVSQLGWDENVLEFHMVFEYLPNNVLHRLMVERYGELDTNHVWKSGARFVPPGTGLSAVVAIDDDSLKFYIPHTDFLHSPKTYLTTLKAHVERILQKMNLHANAERMVYKSDGKRGVFDYEELKHNFANNISKVYSSVWKRDIVIADILDPFAQSSATEEAGTRPSPGPDIADADALLDAIRRSCQKIQDDHVYCLIPGKNSKDMEDLRNRRVRDDLSTAGYNVTDQSQRGSGKTGRGVGEVDLMVRDSNNEPWTIIEALRVSNGTKAPWDQHLDKLIVRYNTRGYPVLYLLTYVDADPQAFSRILKAYQAHAKVYNPKKFTCCKCETLDQTDSRKPQYIRVIKCQYKCGDYTPTVYHIFARIPTPDE